MSAEEPVKLRAGEESDLLASLAAESEERGEAIAGSYLRRCSCTHCGARTLAVPEKVATATCGDCLRRRTGAGAYKPDGTYGTPAGDMLVRQREECVCGFSMAEHLSDKTWTRHVPHLAAQVSSLAGWPVDVLVPSAVVKLRQRAAQAGWMVSLTYSRGYAVKPYRGEWQLEERIAVRLARWAPEVRSAVAVYRTIAGRSAWTWQAVWMWGPSLMHFGHASLTELDEWLAVAGLRDAAWYADIAERKVAAVTASKARAKVTAAARPKSRRGSEEAS